MLKFLVATSFCAVFFWAGNRLGEVRGWAKGRTAGYRACLGALDDDESSRRVWRDMEAENVPR